MAASNNNADQTAKTERRAQARHSSSSGRWAYSYSQSSKADGPQEANPASKAPSREAGTKALYGGATGQRAGGVVLIVAGVVVAVPVLILGAVAAFASLTGVLVLFAVGALGCAALAYAGARKLQLAAAFDRYRNLIGGRQACSIAELASGSATREGKVRSNVKAMISKGMLKQASLDEANDMLFLTRQAAEQHRIAGEASELQQRQRSLAQSVKPKDDEDAARITPDAQRVLDKGEAFIAAIREGNDAIPDEEVSQALGRIEHLVRAIVDTATANPEVIDDLDQLMDYYLPTTVKLLDTYRELEGQPVQTNATRKSKQEIKGALDSLGAAFEKLLDSLFHDKAIDVSSDISVLNTVLAQDGLTENPFEKTSKAAGITESER